MSLFQRRRRRRRGGLLNTRVNFVTPSLRQLALFLDGLDAAAIVRRHSGFSEQQGRCNVTNWTVCWQPVCLTGFSLPRLASGQNIAHIQHSSRARKGYFQASRLLHYLFSIENARCGERHYKEVQYVSKLLSLCCGRLRRASVCLWRIHQSAFLWLPPPRGPRPPTHRSHTHTHTTRRNLAMNTCFQVNVLFLEGVNSLEVIAFLIVRFNFCWFLHRRAT